MNTHDRPGPFRRAFTWSIRLVKTHNTSAIRFIIGTHVVMAVLDWLDRATFQTIEPSVLGNWFESSIWATLNIVLAFALLVFHRPPAVIWALMGSAALFMWWGVLNLYIGITASHPVSLLGPTLLATLAAPLAWTTATNLADKVENAAIDIAEV